LETDKRSRTYVVTRFGSEMTSKPAREPKLMDDTARPVRRKKRGSGRSRKAAAPAEPGSIATGEPPPRRAELEPRPEPRVARDKPANVWSAAAELGLESDGH